MVSSQLCPHARQRRCAVRWSGGSARRTVWVAVRMDPQAGQLGRFLNSWADCPVGGSSRPFWGCGGLVGAAGGGRSVRVGRSACRRPSRRSMSRRMEGFLSWCLGWQGGLMVSGMSMAGWTSVARVRAVIRCAGLRWVRGGRLAWRGRGRRWRRWPGRRRCRRRRPGRGSGPTSAGSRRRWRWRPRR